MFRSTMCAALMGSTVLLMAQPSAPPYQPAVPAPSTYSGYGGFGGYYGGGTVAGSAMQGMASVISAQGNYNLATSAAAVNMTQAQREYIKNRQMWTNTYFEMRAANKAARQAERGPPPSQEQLVRIASEGAPRPLGSHQLDPVSGQIYWPELLQDELFAQQRAEADKLLAKRAEYGRLGISDQNQLGSTIEAMSNTLKDQVRNVRPQQYTEANSFLKSLMFNVTRASL